MSLGKKLGRSNWGRLHCKGTASSAVPCYFAKINSAFVAEQELGSFYVTQASRFAPQPTEIEQASAPHFRRPHQIDLVDHLRVQRENALHALSEADLPHGKAGLRAVVALDHHAFKRLHAFFVALFDLHVNAHRVPGP